MRDPTPVTVRVVYLARLREAFATSSESFVVPAGPDATVAAMLDALRQRGGTFAAELAPGRAVRVAINHAMAKPSDALRDGDEVAIFPPVTGG
jgi:molybdopterin synthase sulfur carrier subunit